MEAIRIINLKSIVDSGTIRIRPLTILVGENSSGKSSIIRSFPLLKQSAESKTLGTVLWSGKYVDYGSFNESVNTAHDNSNWPNEVSFAFQLKVARDGGRSRSLMEGTDIHVNVRVSGDEYAKSSYTLLGFKIYDNEIMMKCSSDQRIISLHINGVDFTRQTHEFYRTFKTYSLIPYVFSGGKIASGTEAIRANLMRELKELMHGRTSDLKISKVARSLRFTDDDQLRRTLTNKAIMGDVAVRKTMAWLNDHPSFEQIKNEIIFCDLEGVLDQVGDMIRAYLMNVRYVTPLRAAADRYYRIQNTSIDELDPNGSNLAMFLHAKRKEEIERLNEWLLEEVGFSLQIVPQHGHASIHICEKSGERSNIADTGFGYSQILPILVQIWQLTARNHRHLGYRTPITIVVEQPELHLHPKMQSRVGDALCKAIEIAGRNGVDIRIVIETHSRELIHAVGRCVEGKVLNKDDVAIYLVDKNKIPNVSESKFDDGGFLQDWPYGFFDGE